MGTRTDTDGVQKIYYEELTFPIGVRFPASESEVRNVRAGPNPHAFAAPAGNRQLFWTWRGQLDQNGLTSFA